MKTTITKPDYSKVAKHYDAAEDSGAEIRDHSNEFIADRLKKHNVSSVLDMSCGTGSQVFYLVNHGYEIVGADICPEMLDIAIFKAQQSGLSLQFLQGDMCELKVGKFDAVITIFNTIGHLAKEKFELALQNIHRNLKEEGIYIFDIFNAKMKTDLVKALKVDAVTEVDNAKIRKIQNSHIDKNNGLMTMTEEEHRQIENKEPTTSKHTWTMQTYTRNWLEEMLLRNDFKLIEIYGPHGSKFSDTESLNMLIVARKI